MYLNYLSWYDDGGAPMDVEMRFTMKSHVPSPPEVPRTMSRYMRKEVPTLSVLPNVKYPPIYVYRCGGSFLED